MPFDPNRSRPSSPFPTCHAPFTLSIAIHLCQTGVRSARNPVTRTRLSRAAMRRNNESEAARAQRHKACYRLFVALPDKMDDQLKQIARSRPSARHLAAITADRQPPSGDPARATARQTVQAGLRRTKRSAPALRNWTPVAKRYATSVASSRGAARLCRAVKIAEEVSLDWKTNELPTIQIPPLHTPCARAYAARHIARARR